MFANAIAGAQARSHVYYAAKYFHVLDLLVKDSSSTRESEFWGMLRILQAQEVIDHGTTFVWLNLHRIFSSHANKDWPLLFRNKEFLKLSTFDAYFKVLQVGATVEINIEEGALCMPKLGIKLPAITGGICVSKASDTRICFRIKDNKYIDINLDNIDETFRFRKAKLLNGPQVLFEKHISLFEEMYVDEVTADPGFCGSIVRELDVAINTVGNYDPDLRDCIVKTVKWLVPIGTPKRERYYSFTSAMMKDTIFLSLLRKDVALIEDIIHEYHHIELSYLMDSEMLFNPSTDEKYYSPWKNAPRPLGALMHAVYVFDKCLEFYAKLNLEDFSKLQQTWITDRVNELYHKVRIGLAQLPVSEMTELGLSLANGIEAHLDTIPTTLEVTDAVPIALLQHREAWRVNNPQLVAY